MHKVPLVDDILTIDPRNTEVTKYKNCQISGAGDHLRIFVDFSDPNLFLKNFLDSESTEDFDKIELRLIFWKNSEIKPRALARYRLTIDRIMSLKTLKKEQFIEFLQNYPDLMEWYLFNPFEISEQ